MSSFDTIDFTEFIRPMDMGGGRLARARAYTFIVLFLSIVGLLATADFGLRLIQHYGLTSAYSHSISERETT